MDVHTIATLLDSHDRLIGIIDANNRMVDMNGRARGALREHRGVIPASLISAAAAVRMRGAQRHGVLIGSVYVQGFFWPMPAELVGFVLRPLGGQRSDEIAALLRIQRWEARQAIAAVQRLSDHNIAVAFTTRHGTVADCIDYLARSICPAASSEQVTVRQTLRKSGFELASGSYNDLRSQEPKLLGRGDYLRMPPQLREPGAAAAVATKLDGRVLCVVGPGEEGYGHLLRDALVATGYEPSVVVEPDAARALLERGAVFDFVLINLDMAAGIAEDLAVTIARTSTSSKIAFFTDGSSSERVVARARKSGLVLAKTWRKPQVRTMVNQLRHVSAQVAPTGKLRGLRAAMAAVKKRLPASR